MSPSKFQAVIRKSKKSRHLQLKKARLCRLQTPVNDFTSTTSPPPSSSTPIASPPPSSSTPIASSSNSPPSHENVSSASKRKLNYFKQFNSPTDTDNSSVEYLFLDIKVLKTLFTSLLCPSCQTSSLCFTHDSKPHMGMATELIIQCTTCDETIVTSSSSIAPHTFDINRRVALGILSLGLGHAGLSSFCEVVGMRPLSKSAFQTHKKTIEAAASTAKAVLLDKTHSIIREAYTSSCLAVPDDLGNLDITVSYDGSWHKRGHTSRHGLGCVIDAVTGLVVDYEAMTQYCQSCATTGKRTKEEGQHTFDEWWASHEPECEANHQGSSGMMEVAAAKILWQRSLQYKFRYITMIGDGDCKTHNELMALKPYGVENPVKKEECISHFSKRLGTALRKVISVAKSDHVTLGGVRRGSLTQNKMALMQKFFTTSILKNPGNLEGMKQAIWAIFHHAASTDLSPQHQYCPTGASSWCPHQKAVAQNLPPPPHTSSIAINDKVAEYIRPTFERLTSNELLQRCLQGKTQNPNESVHSVIWTFIPKGRFVGATRIRLGLYLGAGQFNCGSQSLRDVMKEAGLTVTASTRALGLARDQERISQAERSASAESKRRREIRRRANDRLQAEIERSEGEPAYAPGGF